jgi:hypothetical protein
LADFFLLLAGEVGQRACNKEGEAANVRVGRVATAVAGSEQFLESDSKETLEVVHQGRHNNTARSTHLPFFLLPFFFPIVADPREGSIYLGRRWCNLKVLYSVHTLPPFHGTSLW